jgi:hypothetical protein
VFVLDLVLILDLKFMSIFEWSNRFDLMMPWSIWYFWDSFLAMEIVSLFCALVGHVIGLICLFVHYRSIYVRVHAVISKDKSDMNLKFVLLCAGLCFIKADPSHSRLES